MFPPPSITPPELNDWEFFYNGLRFGDETPLGILNIEGLDLANIRHSNVNWPRDHGQSKGLDLYADRAILFDLWMKTDGTSLGHEQLAVAAATVVLPNEEPPLWFKLPDFPVLCVLCRPLKRLMKYESDYAAARIGKPELSFSAADPRIYGAGVETLLSPNYPATTVTIDNEGNTEMRPIAVFTGPLARPKIGNDTIAGMPFLEFIDPQAEEEEEEFRKKWEAEVTKLTEEIEKESTGKVEKELKEKERKEIKEKGEKESKEKLEKREKEEREGERPTVKAGDQILVDLGTPHLAFYYPGGIAKDEPENIMQWVTSSSRWWDVIPGENAIKFSSFDTKATAGTAELQWASAYQL